MNIIAQTLLRPTFPSRRANSVTLMQGSCAPLTLMASLVMGAMAGVGQAAVTAYEPFAYTTSIPNGTASTASGFTGNWTCGTTPSIAAGMTYTDLPTASGSFISVGTGGRQFVSLSNPLSSGTKWISFLFNQTGNNGADICGVYFANGGTGLFFGYGLAPISGTQGKLGLGSMNTAGTAPLGATSLASSFTGTYGTTPYLVALKIDFNTAGANDTITVYINPTANSATPVVPATYTVASFDVGTITGIGLQKAGGAADIKADEFRVGDSYGDVVGLVSIIPDIPTGLNATSGPNLVSLSWTAATGSPSGYNVKRSSVSGGPYATVGTTAAPTVSYNDSVLGGQTYYYVVSAVNGAGESASSLQVSAAPTLAAPAAPVGLAATAGDAQVSLSWTASAFAANYNVKRATDSGGPYAAIGTTTAPTVMYTDSSDLNNGTTYYYVVSATGTGGTSSDTAPVSATPISPRTVLTIARGAGITWFASNSVTYQVQWSSTFLGTNTVWNNLGGSIAGNGATNTVFDPVGPPHNIYQVLSIQ